MSTFSILSSILCFSLPSIFTPTTAVAPIGTCNSSCSNDTLDVRFPFWLTKNPKNLHGLPGFGLKQLTLTLPNSGDFVVTCIDYKAQTLSINDTDGCLLMRFFQGFDTFNSPFMVSGFDNVFFNCSRDMPSRFRHEPRTCLSSLKFDVLAVYSEIDEFKEETSSWCEEFRSVQIPCRNPSWNVGPMYSASDLAEDVLRFAVPVCGVECTMEKKKKGLGGSGASHVDMVRTSY